MVMALPRRLPVGSSIGDRQGLTGPDGILEKAQDPFPTQVTGHRNDGSRHGPQHQSPQSCLWCRQGRSHRRVDHPDSDLLGAPEHRHRSHPSANALQQVCLTGCHPGADGLLHESPCPGLESCITGQLATGEAFLGIDHQADGQEPLWQRHHDFLENSSRKYIVT